MKRLVDIIQNKMIFQDEKVCKNIRVNLQVTDFNMSFEKIL
jgi:hypothetical protein